MLNALKDMLNEKELHSVVTGRRNWFIRTAIKNGKFFVEYAGKYGNALWLREETLKVIEENHVRFYVFTRKADYLTALKALKALNPVMPCGYEE